MCKRILIFRRGSLGDGIVSLPALAESYSDSQRRILTNSPVAGNPALIQNLLDGAMKEAGDVIQPLESGATTKAAIQGYLFDLTRGQQPGRGSKDKITAFKSVVTSLKDLAAAILAYERNRHPAGPLPS